MRVWSQKQTAPGAGIYAALAAGWEQVWRRLGTRPARRLRLQETIPLGERRFVAVVQFEAERFLIGGGASSVSLLARLGGEGKPPGDDGSRTEDGPPEP